MNIKNQKTALLFVEAYKKSEPIEILGVQFMISEIQLDWPDAVFEARVKLIEVIKT